MSFARLLPGQVLKPAGDQGPGKLEERIRKGILKKEFPGAVMVVMHEGKVILKKGWGETAYGSGRKPSPSASVYDLASLTKAIGTAGSLMHLFDEGKFLLEDSLGRFLPASRGYPIGSLRICDLLAHRTGLPPHFISNYWLFSKNRWSPSHFSSVQNNRFPDPFRGMFLPKGYREQMLRDLAQLPFHGKPKTIYSDLNYALLGYLVETLSGQRQDAYVHQWLVTPMRLRKTCFNPLLNGHSEKEIIPTMALPGSTGWVHDPEAAKLGGVCGAAGLFSTADELARIGEMLRRGGYFQGKQILKSETIRRFAWYRLPGYARAMGWQKPAMEKAQKTIAPKAASPTSFGHTGHTGSLLWVDPEKKLVVVFLTNLTYPDDAPSVFTRNGGYKQILSLAYGLI